MRFTSGFTVTARRWETNQWGKRVVIDEFEVSGCALAPEDVEEDATQGMTVASQAMLFAPFKCGITADYEVTIDGEVWAVNGNAKHWQNPWTSPSVGQLGDTFFLRRPEPVS